MLQKVLPLIKYAKMDQSRGKLNVGRRRPGIQSLTDMSIHHTSSIL